MAYATVPDIKAYLGGFEDASTSDDDKLTALIDRIQAAIDRYCHRTFEASENTTRTFDAIEDVGSGNWENYGMGYSWNDASKQRTLFLDHDLAAINSITNGDGTTVTSGQYVTLPRNRTPFYAIRLKTDANIAWTWDDTPEDAISISGKWAYSTVAPDDVVQACVRLVSWLYKQGETYEAGIDRPMVSPDGILRLPMEWPADVLALLKPLRRL